MMIIRDLQIIVFSLYAHVRQHVCGTGFVVTLVSVSSANWELGRVAVFAVTDVFHQILVSCTEGLLPLLETCVSLNSYFGHTLFISYPPQNHTTLNQGDLFCYLQALSTSRLKNTQISLFTLIGNQIYDCACNPGDLWLQTVYLHQGYDQQGCFEIWWQVQETTRLQEGMRVEEEVIASEKEGQRQKGRDVKRREINKNDNIV